MAEGGQDFDEALKQQINKRVTEILDPDPTNRRAFLMTYFKDGIADLPELETERLDEPKVAEWLKDAVFKYIKYIVGYQKSDNISDGSALDTKMKHMTKLLICYYLTKDNKNEDIKNHDYASKDYLIATLKLLGKPLLEKMPFTIDIGDGSGKPSSKNTHNLRYNMARGGAIHRMRQKQFYKF
jgi:hypothetical protein